MHYDVIYTHFANKRLHMYNHLRSCMDFSPMLSGVGSIPVLFTQLSILLSRVLNCRLTRPEVCRPLSLLPWTHSCRSQSEWYLLSLS